MVLLATCWLIIETIIIPDGYVKWFYLSFYIHPILLFFCQVFLWFKLLQRWIFLLAFFLFEMITYVLGLYILVLRFLKNRIFHFMSSPQENSTGVPSDQTVLEEPQILHSIPCITYQAVVCSTGMLGYDSCELQRWNFEEESWYDVGLHLEDTETENSCDSSGFSPTPNDMYMAESLSPAESSISSLISMELSLEGEENALQTGLDTNEQLQSQSLGNAQTPSEPELIHKRPDREVDAFYETYAKRMKWFDVLYRDRLYGIDAILADLERSSYLASWEKLARKKLITSLRWDFELVYVAQSCLSWDALQHQYWKVKTVASSSSENNFFRKNIIDRFKMFQILLERFMEEEPYEGKQYMHYVHRRFSIKSLLQVPEVLGYMEENNERMNGEAMKATEVLGTIENCIRVFWLFVKANGKQPIWKIFSNGRWTHPPVDDPRDLELFYVLKKMLKKKELLVKRLKAKKKCWLKKSVNPLGTEYVKSDLLFIMIDLKLVQKVLGIAAISTSQLKWCETKLNSIRFIEGKIHRPPATSSHLLDINSGLVNRLVYVLPFWGKK